MLSHPVGELQPSCLQMHCCMPCLKACHSLHSGFQRIAHSGADRGVQRRLIWWVPRLTLPKFCLYRRIGCQRTWGLNSQPAVVLLFHHSSSFVSCVWHTETMVNPKFHLGMFKTLISSPAHNIIVLRQPVAVFHVVAGMIPRFGD